MSTGTLDLPELTGTRTRASRFLEGLPEHLEGSRVVISAKATLAATDSFVDEVVRSVLVDRRADRLIVELAGPDMQRRFADAAARHSVTDRIDLLSGPLDS